MNIFYKIFYCCKTNYQSDDKKIYHKICDFVYTTDGMYLGTYNGTNTAMEVDTMAIHPDELLCCFCLCCCPSFVHNYIFS